MHYGIIDAGEAVLEIKDSPYTFENRDAYYAVGTGRSLGAFDMFFKVRDKYETYIDKKGVFPWYFKRRLHIRPRSRRGFHAKRGNARGPNGGSRHGFGFLFCENIRLF